MDKARAIKIFTNDEFDQKISTYSRNSFEMVKAKRCNLCLAGDYRWLQQVHQNVKLQPNKIYELSIELLKSETVPANFLSSLHTFVWVRKLKVEH